jgi:hypothetical protein
MANSTTTLKSIVAWARTFPDIASIVQVPVAGASSEPALTIANDVMIAMLSEPFNWKWNRFKLPLFNTNSWQQDYALNVVNLGWLEHGVLVDINNTALPKPQYPLECVKDLEQTSAQYGIPGQACWLPNDQLIYGTWGAPNTGNTSYGNNPQPNSVITNPLGQTAMPANPILQVRDAFDNLWVVTGFGTTGASNPFATNLNPVYPTSSNPTQAATTVTDGTVTWTAVNPKGMGIRLYPIPPQTGLVYQVNLIGQWRPFAFSNGPFTSLSQTIEPIPDDYASWFRAGFVAYAYEHSPDKQIRGKAADMKLKWMEGLRNSRVQGDRERDNAGFYPSNALLPQPWPVYPGPAWPYPVSWY